MSCWHIAKPSCYPVEALKHVCVFPPSRSRMNLDGRHEAAVDHRQAMLWRLTAQGRL